jgi:hypothetical protein
MIKQAFKEESQSRTWRAKTHRDRKKVKWVESRVESILIIFFDIRGAVHKENSSWQAKQSIQHITVTF